jgi:hypothetical protein
MDHVSRVNGASMLMERFAALVGLGDDSDDSDYAPSSSESSPGESSSCGSRCSHLQDKGGNERPPTYGIVGNAANAAGAGAQSGLQSLSDEEASQGEITEAGDASNRGVDVYASTGSDEDRNEVGDGSGEDEVPEAEGENIAEESSGVVDVSDEDGR